MNRPFTAMRKFKQLAEIQRDIEKLFEGVEHEVQYSVSDRHVFIQVRYEDFKPRRVVRNAIEDIADNIEIEDIQRAYSDHHLVEALWEAADSADIYVKQGDNFVHCDILNLMHDLLMNRTF